MKTPNTQNHAKRKILALVALLVVVATALVVPCSANGWQTNVTSYYTPHPLTPYAIAYNGIAERYHTNTFAFPRGSNSAFTDIDTFYYGGTGYGERTTLSINATAENQRITANFEANSTFAQGGAYSYCSLHWGVFKYDGSSSADAYLPTIQLRYDWRETTEYLNVFAEGVAVRYDGSGNRQEVEVIYQVPYNVPLSYSGVNGYYNVNLRTILSLIEREYDATEYVRLSLTFSPKTLDASGNPVNNVDVTFQGCSIVYSVINEYTPIDTLTTTHTYYQQIVNNGDASDFLGVMSDWVSDFFSTVLFHFGYVPITPGAILSVGAGLALTIWILKLFMGG